MRYVLELEINLPRSDVVALLYDPTHLQQWQPNLISVEYISGTVLQVGAKSRRVYMVGRQAEEQIETVLVNDLPHVFSASYESAGLWNRIDHQLVEVSPQVTKWRYASRIRSTGFVQVKSFLLTGRFREQSETMMQQFKHFAESRPVA